MFGHYYFIRYFMLLLQHGCQMFPSTLQSGLQDEWQVQSSQGGESHGSSPFLLQVLDVEAFFSWMRDPPNLP